MKIKEFIYIRKKENFSSKTNQKNKSTVKMKKNTLQKMHKVKHPKVEL